MESKTGEVNGEYPAQVLKEIIIFGKLVIKGIGRGASWNEGRSQLTVGWGVN